MPVRRAVAVLIFALLWHGGAAAAALQRVPLAYLGETRAGDAGAAESGAAVDEGLAGAHLGVADNNSTGRFVGLEFELLPTQAAGLGQLISRPSAGAPVTFAVADLPSKILATIARQFPALTFINVRARSDRLRNEDCAANVLHTISSRAMLADALAQYLVWKRWTRWFLVVGSSAADAAYADAVRRAAAKFGASISAEKAWTFGAPNVRADTGHATLQTEIPAFTRVGDYDVLIVADEEDEFGEELVGRTFLPRPVAGTHGLIATTWSRVNEQWGALQLQRRFEKEFKRAMRPRDYAAWLAVRAIGEAAVRTGSADAGTVRQYMLGPEFLLSGFKGRGQSFRPWDGQMRQRVLIAGPRRLVSASPQQGFLHRVSELDTLGTDKDESACRR